MEHADGDMLGLAQDSMEEQMRQEEQMTLAAEFAEQMLGEKERADEELAEMKKQLAANEMELQAAASSASHWAAAASAREEELARLAEIQQTEQAWAGQMTVTQAEELERAHNEKMLEAEQITSDLLRRQEQEAQAREEANFTEAEEMVTALAQQKQVAEAEVARMKAKVLRQEKVAKAAQAEAQRAKHAEETATVQKEQETAEIIRKAEQDKAAMQQENKGKLERIEELTAQVKEAEKAKISEPAPEVGVLTKQKEEAEARELSTVRANLEAQETLTRCNARVGSHLLTPQPSAAQLSARARTAHAHAHSTRARAMANAQTAQKIRNASLPTN
jgi:hypothetical protein